MKTRTLYTEYCNSPYVPGGLYARVYATDKETDKGFFLAVAVQIPIDAKFFRLWYEQEDKYLTKRGIK